MAEKEFSNPTIVVTWHPKKYGLYGCFAVLDALPQMSVRIKGAGFLPGEGIKITACEKNIFVAEAKTNKCGAFEIFVNLPAGLPMDVITVRAWGEVAVAVWPLDIVKRIPPLPRDPGILKELDVKA